MTAPRTVIVKFRRLALEADQRAHLVGLVADDIAGTAGVFPGDDEFELATLVEVRLHEGADATDVVKRLEQNDEIEYAHEQVERRGLEGQGGA